jgi:hypothetical protein
MSEILMKLIISAVLALLLSAMSTAGYAASANLTVHVAPVTAGTCALGSHNAVRGRPTVSHGTLLADDNCPLRGMGPAAQTPTYTAYGFDPSTSNGPLKIYQSSTGGDGTWSQVSSSYATQPTFLRDPRVFTDQSGNIVKYNGLYWMAHTDTNATSSSFALASSTDGLHWTYVKDIDCSPVTTGSGGFCWAPSFYMDNGGGMHTTTSMSPPAQLFQQYEQHPTTSDPAGAWSAPSIVSGLPSTSTLDFKIVRDGTATLRAFYVNGTGSVEHVSEATSSSDCTNTSCGGFTEIHNGDWAGWGNHQESPSLLKIGNTWNIWFWYFGSGITNFPRHSTTSDITGTTWSSVTDPGFGTAMDVTHVAVLSGAPSPVGACADASAPADPTNGQPLETVAGYQCARDNFKVNTIRETLWVGERCNGCGTMEDVTGDIARMDAAVAAANATGMYVIAANFSNAGSSGNCTTAWNNSATLWSGIAARYKDNTNVIFELHNEPDLSAPGGCGNASSNMNSLYNTARGAAPNTPIIAWSFSSPTASTSNNLDSQIASATSINYSNTVIGVHAYDNNESAMTSFVQSENGNGRGVYMTAYGPCQDSSTNWAPTIRNLETFGIDWVGSCTLIPVGGSGSNGITVFWPSDTGSSAPQTPVSISFSPSNPISVSDVAPSGYAIAGINVGTSDGQAFGGTISLASQTNTTACAGGGLVNISSTSLPSNVRANCAFTAALNGSPTVTIHATENGTTVSATLTMNVAAPNATSTFDTSRNPGGNLTFANSNLKATDSAGTGTNYMAFTTRFLSSGQHVFRFTLGTCTLCGVGMADSAESNVGYLGGNTGAHSFGIFGSGSVSISGASVGSTNLPYGSGDVVDVIVDLTAKTVRVAVNGGTPSAAISISAMATMNLSPGWSTGVQNDSATFVGGAPVSYFGEANWDGIAVPADHPTSITFDGTGGSSTISVSDTTASGTTIAGIHVHTQNIAPFGGTIAFVSQSNTTACSNTGLVKITSTTAPSNIVANCTFTSAYDTGATPAAVTMTATQNGTTTSPTTLQMNIAGGIPCAIGPLFTGTIPAPAVAAGYTTCVANYDFSTTNNFTTNGNVYNFSNIATWFGCGGESTALWWISGYNDRSYPACQDFSIVNDATLGKNVLQIAYTALDANNGNAAAYMSQRNGSFGGGPPATGFDFPQGLYMQWSLEMLPANTNPYSTDSKCQPQGTNYCELMNFFSLGTSGAFNEWDTTEMDSSGAQSYSGGNQLWPSNSGNPNNQFSYHDYGMRLTTDGSTAISKCNYIDGNHTTAGSLSSTGCYEHWDGVGSGFQYAQRQYWGMGLGSNEAQQCYFGGACPVPSPNQQMRVPYIRIFSCAGWATGECNTGIINTP